MPKEFRELEKQPQPLSNCPRCGAPFECFLRGLVQSYWRKLLRMPYCTVICGSRKEIVGHERPYVFEPLRDDSLTIPI